MRADVQVSAPQLLFINKRLAPASYDGLAMLMQVCLHALVALRLQANCI
jgi:hypothetical protein